MKKILATLAVAASTLCYALPSAAALITFDSLASADDNFAVGSSYTEGGFVLDDITTTSSFGFATWGTSSPFYVGSTALINDNDDGLTRLTQVGGGLFNLTSIDLAVMYPGITDDGETTVTFTGYRSDNSTVEQMFFINDGLAQTSYLNGFTDLTSVVWTNGAMYNQFDNISVSGSVPAAVPLPGALALFAPALGLLGFVGRRRVG